MSNRAPSYTLNYEDAVNIQKRIINGEFLNRIAADYDVNPGRISEIKSGKRFEGSFKDALDSMKSEVD